MTEQPVVERAWIQTASGGKFHLLDPRPEEVDIRDIAHSLSQQCRFTGHTLSFYSVAEHSYRVSLLVPLRDALWALLHDASEAYISDLNRPAKHLTDVGVHYLPLEAKIMTAICKKFGLPTEPPESVHLADNGMLYAEKDQLLPPMDWTAKWGRARTSSTIDTECQCWLPATAEAIFLRRYEALTGCRVVPLLQQPPRRNRLDKFLAERENIRIPERHGGP